MDHPSSSNEIVTVVLVGKSGNGKSATGNSVMGRTTFTSSLSMKSVTKTAELRTSNLIPDQTIDIIDTPGLFDTTLGYKAIGEEIVKCIDLAKKGIHAVLIVLSVRKRFSEEEEAAIYCLQNLFGSKIFDYVIVLFTGGDSLFDPDEDDRDDNDRLDDYLRHNSPRSLKDILQLCGDRKVLFDNRTKDKSRKSQQVQRLLSLVDQVRTLNGREPYTHRHFQMDGKVKLRGKEVGFEGEISFMKERIQTAYDEQLKQITQKMESDLREATRMLQDEMARERTTKLKEKVASEEESAKLKAQVEEMSKQIKTMKEMAERSNSKKKNWKKVDIPMALPIGIAAAALGIPPLPIPDIPLPIPDCNIL